MASGVVIACSGLGHIRRGNETWAADVATALHAAGAEVLLVGGGPAPDARCSYRRLPHLPRDFPLWRRWVPWSKRYLVEQLSFLLPLRRFLLRSGRRVVHLCDPDLALQLVKRTRGSGLQVAFKDGMLLGPHWCSRMPFVQVLAPYYRDGLAREAGVDTRNWFVIPHLVEVDRFRPAPDRVAARRAWPELGLPPEALVVVGVGDFSPQGNKRLDWLVSEVASIRAGSGAPAVHLVLAGQAASGDFARFEAAARGALGDHCRLLRNLPRADVARLYHVADVYAHAATREPFGIVFLEAMASGLPLAGHPWEVTRWIIGEAGETVDMTVPGALRDLLCRWRDHPAERAEIAGRARRRAVEHFGAASLVPKYLAMYERMAAGG